MLGTLDRRAIGVSSVRTVHASAEDRPRRIHVVVESEPANPAASLEGVLTSLVQRIDGARDAVLADRDGLPIATAAKQRMKLELASAMAALIVRAALRVLEHVGPDRFQCAILEGSAVRILVCQVSEGAGCLILVTDTDANLGLAKVELVRAAIYLTTVLDMDVM